MAKIKVHARIHPSTSPTNLIEIEGDRLLAFKNAQRRNSSEIGFTFDSIFQGDASQAEVFNSAARDVVEKFILGFNGTIFAYGQTGTGKTYTIEGEELSKNTSTSHGLIPQTLSFLFKELENLKEECVTVQISFIELYNETAFDLLGPLMYGNNNKRDLPKVLISLGANGSCLCHGLSIHNVSDAYEARRLHLRGRYNRSVAFTVNNNQSSRSHAIFTILLTRQSQDSEVVLKSKLNLVDLAGSESINKKHDDGVSMLNCEQKHINLSLHYLETVILSLQNLYMQELRLSRSEESQLLSTKKNKRCKSASVPHRYIKDRLNSSANSTSWNTLKCQSAIGFNDTKPRGRSFINTNTHVSVRNSLLTMFLQDSLGGNCNTVMIATLSMQPSNFMETVLTCRFAQRVARVTNTPVINKDVNVNILVKKLQNKVLILNKKLSELKQCAVDKNGDYQIITPEEKAEVINIVRGYLNGCIGDPLEKGIDGPHKVHACLAYLKDLVIKGNHKFSSEPNSSDEKDSGVGIYSSMPTNSEDEPCSPTSTSVSRNPLKRSPITSSQSVNIPSVVYTSSTMRNDVSTTPSRQYCAASLTNATPEDTVQLQNVKKSEATTPSSHCFFPSVTDKGRLVARDFSAKRSEYQNVDDAENKLLLWELELQKENLIQKSKLLGTALANQKARILVMEKHGCVMDDIDNERLAEQQLLRKQTYIEQHLAVIVKRIVDVKSANVGHQESAAVDQTGIGNNKAFIRSKPDVLQSRKLELQEQSTRLQLLTHRERLVPGISTSLDQIVTESQPTLGKQGHSLDTASISSFATSTSSCSTYIKTKKTSKGLVQSASRSRRVALINNKPRSRLSVSTNKSATGRHLSKTQLGPQKLRLSSSINSRRSTGISVFNKQTSSNMLQSKHKQMLSGRFQRNLSSSFSPLQEMDRKAARKSVGSYISSTDEKIPAPSSSKWGIPRTRRPAMCSTDLSIDQSTRQTPRSQPSIEHYDFEPSNGFILRTNNEVYKASSFKNDELVNGDKSLPTTVAIKKTCNTTSGKYNKTLDSSSGEYSEGVQNTCNPFPVKIHEDSQSYKKEASHGPIEENLSENIPSLALQTQTSSNADSINGHKHEALPETNASASQQESKVICAVSLVVVKARKQQLERIKQIRKVNNAVEVIQAAYRNYKNHRKAQ